jgi:hypothetical protein
MAAWEKKLAAKAGDSAGTSGKARYRDRAAERRYLVFEKKKRPLSSERPPLSVKNIFL